MTEVFCGRCLVLTDLTEEGFRTALKLLLTLLRQTGLSASRKVEICNAFCFEFKTIYRPNDQSDTGI